MFETRDCKAVLNIPEAKLGIARTPRATKGKLRLMRTILIQVVTFSDSSLSLDVFPGWIYSSDCDKTVAKHL